MADPRQDSEEADARVAAAKARLRALSADTRPGYHLALQASNLMRRRPWQGVGLALLAGVALGLAPREAVRRLAVLAPPLVGVITGVRPDPSTSGRSGVGASGPTDASAGVRRPR